MDWFYSENGEQRGPVSDAEVKKLIESGNLKSGDLIWRDGMADWKPAGETSEFSHLFPAAPAAGRQEESPPQTVYAPPQTSTTASHSYHSNVQVPNYLWQSIVVTLLCCLPFGIPAIVFAAKVDSLVAAGNIAAAQQASGQARTWCWVAFGIGLAQYVVVFAIYGLALVGALAGGA